MEPQSHEVICQEWDESEKGWGVRPDGFSLHISLSSLEKFVNKYWEQMPTAIPDEYSFTRGYPYAATVDDELYQKIVGSEHGIRMYGRNYPKRIET